MDVQHLKGLIRDVPDFPKPGILFKDITPLLQDPIALDECIRLLAAPFREAGIDQVLGIESRGFILAPLVARELHAGFVPVRKRGKLPHEVLQASYALEYGEDTIEMHVDAVRPGHDVLIVDDLIATGGTAAAACQLVERAGGVVRGLSFLVELSDLRGRQALDRFTVHSILNF
jgi:adenine phosphoribosyltransferase